MVLEITFGVAIGIIAAFLLLWYWRQAFAVILILVMLGFLLALLQH